MKSRKSDLTLDTKSSSKNDLQQEDLPTPLSPGAAQKLRDKVIDKNFYKERKSLLDVETRVEELESKIEELIPDDFVEKIKKSASSKTIQALMELNKTLVETMQSKGLLKTTLKKTSSPEVKQIPVPPLPKVTKSEKVAVDDGSESDTNDSARSASNHSLDSLQSLQHAVKSSQDSKKEVELDNNSVSMDGFFNLALVFLFASIFVNIVNNYMKKGFLVDFSLLYCMLGRVTDAIVPFTIMLIEMLGIYSISLVNMYFIRRKDADGKKKTKTTNAQSILYLLSGLSYLILQIGMVYSVVRLTFEHRYPVFISLIITIGLMIYVMKLHSYMAYVMKEFSPDGFFYQYKRLHTREANVGLKEFFYFIAAPTLCFFRFYPKTDRIRKSHIVTEILLALGCLIAMYVILLQYLDPIFREVSNDYSLSTTIYAVVRVSIPWFIVWLLGSFALFHCYLNILAELTCFADRLWYKDWWNSLTFEVFWSKWNLPVHHFLLKHVYLESLRMNFSKPIAVLATFFLSAVLHEVCMSVMFRSTNFYFFGAMIVQAPTVVFGKLLQPLEKYALGRRLLNLIMWFSLFTGQPLMLLLYFRDWYTKENKLCVY